MWTNILILCILYLSIGDVQSQDQQKEKVINYFNDKCYRKTGHLNAFNKLDNDYKDFSSYLQYAFSLIPEKGEEFCHYERKRLNDKAIEVAKDLKPCLSKEEEYLSEFIETSFKEFTHFLCHNNREYMKRIFSDHNKQCRESLGGGFTSSAVSCFGRIFRPRSDNYLTKKELCDDISVAEKCFADALSTSCPHSSSSYKNLNEIFFRYISKPCSGSVFQMNTLLLLMSVVLSYLFSKN